MVEQFKKIIKKRKEKRHTLIHINYKSITKSHEKRNSKSNHI